MPVAFSNAATCPRNARPRQPARAPDIYRKFHAVDLPHTPIKIFPAVHYTMGGLWCDDQRRASGAAWHVPQRSRPTSPALTLSANASISITVGVLTRGWLACPSVPDRGGGRWIRDVRTCRGPAAAELPFVVVDRAAMHLGGLPRDACPAQGGPNPYRLHAARPVDDAHCHRCAEEQTPGRGRRGRRRPGLQVSLSDRQLAESECGFCRALEDMFPVAKAVLRARPATNAVSLA